MYSTKHIDWLSITFPTDVQLRSVFGTLDWRFSGKGRHGYKFAYRDSITGATYQECAASDDMGVHLTLSGDALNMLRSERGGTDDGLLNTCSTLHGYVSRIDLTLNIHEGKVTVQDVYKAVKNGSLRARTSTYRLVEGKRGNILGDTIYLGSPKSDRQLRCYNKAAEMGIVDGAAWLRLELELRALRANAAFQSAVSNGVSAAVSGHVEDFMAWSNSEFKSALAGPSAPPHELPRKETARRKWLLGQVAQALAKECREDVNFRPLFDAAVLDAIDKLSSAE